MKFRSFSTIAAVAVCVGLIASCNSAGNTSNANHGNSTVNLGTHNANANAVVTNSGNANARWNANMTREEYERNRADYEKEKGNSVIGTGPNDMWLWVKTKASLAAADDITDSGINVDVEDEIVTLKGTVATPTEKNKAEQTAKAVQGVRTVRNQLTVSPAGGNTATANANANKH